MIGSSGLYVDDSIIQFKENIEQKLDLIPKPIDFKGKFNMSNAPPKPTGLGLMFARASAIEEVQILLAKVNRIKKYPELLDLGLVEKWHHANIIHVSI